MTLEEIFHAYEFNLRHGFVNNADKYREAIIAALKAGQALAEAVEQYNTVKGSRLAPALANYLAATSTKEHLSGCSECDAEGCFLCEP